MNRSQQLKKICHGVQIIHDHNNHWVLASNYRRKDNIVDVYDSVYSSVSAKTCTIVKNLFKPVSTKNPRVQIVKTQKQIGNHECGLFAIALAK